MSRKLKILILQNPKPTVDQNSYGALLSPTDALTLTNGLGIAHQCIRSFWIFKILLKG